MTTLVGAPARRLIGAALFSLLAAGPATSADQVIDLTIDFAKVQQYDRPFDDLIIGNPGIADITERDDRSFVLTGKAAGVTNLIVLDDKGDEIAHALVRVSTDVRQLTTVFKAGQRQTFSCSPVCEQVISVGDEKTAFEQAATQIQGRTQFATGQ